MGKLRTYLLFLFLAAIISSPAYAEQSGLKGDLTALLKLSSDAAAYIRQRDVLIAKYFTRADKVEAMRSEIDHIVRCVALIMLGWISERSGMIQSYDDVKGALNAYTVSQAGYSSVKPKRNNDIGLSLGFALDKDFPPDYLDETKGEKHGVDIRLLRRSSITWNNTTMPCVLSEIALFGWCGSSLNDEFQEIMAIFGDIPRCLSQVTLVRGFGYEVPFDRWGITGLTGALELVVGISKLTGTIDNRMVLYPLASYISRTDRIDLYNLIVIRKYLFDVPVYAEIKGTKRVLRPFRDQQEALEKMANILDVDYKPSASPIPIAAANSPVVTKMQGFPSEVQEGSETGNTAPYLTGILALIIALLAVAIVLKKRHSRRGGRDA